MRLLRGGMFMVEIRRGACDVSQPIGTNAAAHGSMVEATAIDTLRHARSPELCRLSSPAIPER